MCLFLALVVRQISLAIALKVERGIYSAAHRHIGAYKCQQFLDKKHQTLGISSILGRLVREGLEAVQQKHKAAL